MTARRSADDRGSAAMWVLSCCALLTVVTGVATVRALAVLVRHRAEAAADLAALAAAEQIGRDDAGACAAAARIARQNGAGLRNCGLRLDADGRSGSVVVRVELRAGLPVVGQRAVLASARAARLPARGPANPACRAVACWLASSLRAPPASAAPQEGTETAWTSRSRGRQPAMSRSSP